MDRNSSPYTERVDADWDGSLASAEAPPGGKQRELQPHGAGAPQLPRDAGQVDEQACALGDELVVDLGVGGDDQREVGVLERVVR